ncbi:hypothetical protein [Altererythrobacter sp. ZODW24]|uniref:hypothetical protein n=1 Tax=Altererythrobacter sp. ZODW24 TaxID=2185142 RepID=UPI000DF77AE5|nr:hypothetical protein [Altererythrobacter sp. ZODW24]
MNDLNTNSIQELSLGETDSVAGGCIDVPAIVDAAKEGFAEAGVPGAIAGAVQELGSQLSHQND